MLFTQRILARCFYVKAWVVSHQSIHRTSLAVSSTDLIDVCTCLHPMLVKKKKSNQEYAVPDVI